jgi:hypothetical protein
MQSPTITKKQTEILLLLYRFRFLSRQHIQTILNHEYPNRIKVWLADLTEKKAVGRTYSRKFGENTKPAVYFLDKNSRDILKEQEKVNPLMLKRIYSEKTRSQYFREHSMFLADIYLNLRSQMKVGTDDFHFLTKGDLEDYDYLPKPRPDAYIVIKREKETKRYFLEIVSEQVPRFALRKRIEYLFKYYSSGVWEKNTKYPFPSILIVCPSYITRAFLSKFISQTRGYEEDELSFFLTTEDQIRTRGVKNDIWQKAD